MSRRRIVWLVLAGLLGAAAGAIAQFPAARALALVEPAGIAVSGVQGTVWRGSAERVVVPEAPPLAAVRWHVSPWPLLTGELAGTVRFDLGGGEGEGRFRVDRAGTIAISDAEFRGPASGIARYLPLPLYVDGDLTAHLARATLVNGEPRDVEARARWDRAAVREPLDVALGAVTVGLDPEEGGSHRFTLDAREGAVEADGGGGVTVDGRYDVDLRIEPTERADAEVVDLLETFARRDNGAFVIRDSGNLPW